MKKGISLIVLVITIIVMIIIAGAIIISLNSTDIVNRANAAVKSSNLAELKSAVAIAYGNQMSKYYEDLQKGVAPTEVTADTVAADTTVASLLTTLNNSVKNDGIKYEIVAGASGGVVVNEASL